MKSNQYGIELVDRTPSVIADVIVQTALLDIGNVPAHIALNKVLWALNIDISPEQYGIIVGRLVEAGWFVSDMSIEPGLTQQPIDQPVTV